jgi:hypothetical protein
MSLIGERQHTCCRRQDSVLIIRLHNGSGERPLMNYLRRFKMDQRSTGKFPRATHSLTLLEDYNTALSGTSTSS